MSYPGTLKGLLASYGGTVGHVPSLLALTPRQFTLGQLGATDWVWLGDAPAAKPVATSSSLDMKSWLISLLEKNGGSCALTKIGDELKKDLRSYDGKLKNLLASFGSTVRLSFLCPSCSPPRSTSAAVSPRPCWRHRLGLAQSGCYSCCYSRRCRSCGGSAGIIGGCMLPLEDHWSMRLWQPVHPPPRPYPARLLQGQQLPPWPCCRSPARRSRCCSRALRR